MESTERVGHQTAVIIKGIVEMREGQHLRRGASVWTVVKRHWLRKPHVSVILNPAANTSGNPEIGWDLELMYDPVEGENVRPEVPDLTVETVLPFKKTAVICGRGVLKVKVKDVLTDGEQTWKVLDTTVSEPAQPDRVWISIQTLSGTSFNPHVNIRLLIAE